MVAGLVPLIGHSIIKDHIEQRGGQQNQVRQQRSFIIPENRADHEPRDHDEKTKPLGKVFLDIEIARRAPGASQQLAILNRVAMERTDRPTLPAITSLGRFRRLNMVDRLTVKALKCQLHESGRPTPSHPASREGEEKLSSNGINFNP
jgi:hypothetical protein